MSDVDVAILLATYLAAFVFGFTVPKRVTDSLGGQLAVALAGGFLIGALGAAVMVAA